MTDLDPLIHAPKRLRLMAILSTFDHVAFARLQERLGLTAPDLSKQLRTLQDAGFVSTRRSGRGPGSQTWVTMTRSGRRAYDAHVTALRAVLDGPAEVGADAPIDGAPDDPTGTDGNAPAAPDAATPGASTHPTPR